MLRDKGLYLCVCVRSVISLTNRALTMVVKPEPVVDTFQQYYQRPVELSTRESFRRFLYNKEDKSVFGRTSSSWCKKYIFVNNQLSAAVITAAHEG